MSRSSLASCLRWPRALRSVALLVGGALALAAMVPALSQVSPAIAPSRIEIDDPIRQGDEVRLPSLSVSNRGDEAGVFVAEVTVSANQDERTPDTDWFEFSPQRVELEAGGGAQVAVRLKIPRDATPGRYRALLRARVVAAPGDGGGGAVISAAVAATLLFTVENRNFHFYDPVTDFFRDRAPFSYIGVGMLLAVLAAYLVRQRFKFRISFGVERRE